ncbi:MAG: hypothetical protein AB2385_15470 [Symbiobacterium sp.]|uniref:hypothetical protein n=1 Tax=Symbiobacterium sp. TaxID=1971213 RepID=UPI0034644ADB
MIKVTDSVTSFKDLVQWLSVKLAEDFCRQVESVLEEIESQHKRRVLDSPLMRVYVT